MSLTTYRRDGTAVSTAVWFVEEDGRLLVITPAESYKARRLRRNPAAMVAPSTARVKAKGDAIPAQVEFLPPDEIASA
jgi:PPOX class probable F420-dependent enzyme